MKKFIVKNSGSGAVKEYMFPANISEKEVLRIKEYLALGGKSTKEYSIQMRQANKAYTVQDTDIALVATALNQTEAWVNENLYFVRMIASDTTIDSQWDKFSEGVIRKLGEQYSEGWADGEIGGRNICVMHEREDMVGKTYRYEIVDAVGKDGTVMVDENGAPIKQLIVYGYIAMTAQYEKEAVVNYVKDGRLCKVSISAWVSGWTYIPEEQSNWRPEGEGTEPYGYFFFPDESMVEAIELSLVDMGANVNARITKNKMADPNISVEVAEDEPKPTITTETVEEDEDEVKAEKALTEKVQSLWDNTPEVLRNKGVVIWEELTLKNHGDGKAFFAPDYCATKFKNMDKQLGKQNNRVKELELRVAELEGSVSQSNDKAIAITSENDELQTKNTQNLDKIIELNATLEKMTKELGEVKEEYIQKYATYTCQIENDSTSDYVQATIEVAKGYTLSELKSKVDALLPILMKKRSSEKLLAEKKAKESEAKW